MSFRASARLSSLVGVRIAMLLPPAAALLPAAALPPPATAQTVRGVVTDEVTGAPIPLATVSLVSEGGERVATVLTTEEGFFSLEGDDDGLFLVRAAALGYAPARAGPLRLDDDELRVLEMPMAPSPVGIEGLVVERSRGGGSSNYLADKGFWDRLEEGRGQFLTPGQVLASDAMFTPHLLRGLDYVLPQYGAAPWAIWPSLGITERHSCSPRVYVDDVWVNRKNFGISERLGLDDVVPIDRVLAVEVYYGPFQAPIRYQGTAYDNSCGVVLFWTR